MNIYVGNLSLNVTEAELRQKFIAFGVVESLVIMNDKYIGSGQPRVYGFVQMQSRSEGEAAICGLNGKTVTSRILNVIEALPLSDCGRKGFYGKASGKRSSKIRNRIYQIGEQPCGLAKTNQN